MRTFLIKFLPWMKLINIITSIVLILGLFVYAMSFVGNKDLHHQQGEISKVHGCNGDACLVDVDILEESDADDKKDVEVNGMVREGMKVYRECYYSSGDRMCYVNWKKTYDDRYSKTFDEIDQE